MLTIVGTEFFIDATQFIPALMRPVPVAASFSIPLRNVPVQSMPLTAAIPSMAHPAPGISLPYDDLGYVHWERYEQKTLEIMHLHFNDKKEVWLSPYLTRLRSEIQELTEQERKQLITRLADTGVFRVEKRAGTPYDFSVLIVNWNNPRVQSTYNGR